MNRKKSMPDFAKKAALEKEVVHVLETYGKRLLAVQRTLEDAADSVTIAKQIEEIRNENDGSLQRLQENLRIAARSPDPSTDVLGSVWNTIRIKILYHSVLVEASTAAKTCAKWKHRHDVLEAMERHNREIFGRGRDDIRNYVSIFSYPNIVKDHLFNIRNILEKYNKITKCSGYKRVVDLISWLDHEQPNVTSIKGMTTEDVFNKINKPDEVVLQKGRMRMPICDSGDAGNAEVILSESLVVVRTLPRRMFCKGKVEFSTTVSVDVEEGSDERTLHVLGIGFRKVLIADSREKRDEWLASFRDIKRNAMLVSR